MTIATWEGNSGNTWQARCTGTALVSLCRDRLRRQSLGAAVATAGLATAGSAPGTSCGLAAKLVFVFAALRVRGARVAQGAHSQQEHRSDAVPVGLGTRLARCP